MKTKSKALLLTLCAVLLVAASVMGTMAYLTSTTETVTNTFSVGDVKITLDEAKVDENGTPVEGAARVIENSYKLLPGHVYTKDPTVHVAEGSEECYLFVKVVDEIAEIEENSTVAEQMATLGWTKVPGETDVYVYGNNTTLTTVTAGSDVTVFQSIVIKGTVDNVTLEKYANKTITVTAYAIQKDGFENMSAADIWNEI